VGLSYSKTCLDCGEKRNSGSEPTCKNCGHVLRKSKAVSHEVAPLKRTRKTLIVLTGFAVFVVVVAGSVCLIRRYKPETPESSTVLFSTSESETAPLHAQPTIDNWWEVTKKTEPTSHTTIQQTTTEIRVTTIISTSTAMRQSSSSATRQAITTVSSTSKPSTTVAAALNGVSINSGNLHVNKGEKGVLTATVTPHNANDVEVKWSSGNGMSVAMYSDGRWEALRSGRATITVTAKDKHGSFKDTIVIMVN